MAECWPDGVDTIADCARNGDRTMSRLSGRRVAALSTALSPHQRTGPDKNNLNGRSTMVRRDRSAAKSASPTSFRITYRSSFGGVLPSGTVTFSFTDIEGSFTNATATRWNPRFGRRQRWRFYGWPSRNHDDTRSSASSDHASTVTSVDESMRRCPRSQNDTEADC
jgi:hypothetical protein